MQKRRKISLFTMMKWDDHETIGVPAPKPPSK